MLWWRKTCCWNFIFDYERIHKLEVRVARIFNTYGPGMHPYDGRVVSNFVMLALDNQDITIYGDGWQTRSLCYVDDLIDQIIRFMENVIHSGPMNLRNSNEISILQLTKLILKLTNSRSKIIFAAYLKMIQNRDVLILA